MIDIFALCMGLVLFVRGVTTMFFLEKSLKWFRNNYRKQNINPKSLPRLIIIIPVLREQKRIIPTLDYFIQSFGRYPIKIKVATTQKEYEKDLEHKSTQDLVENYIYTKNFQDLVEVIDYPQTKGKKAHQLNYVIEKVEKNTDFIAVYDADSRPHKDTLKAFYEQIKVHPEAEVFQQSALFINNYRKISDPLLRASAILQSRWTLAHEMARLLRQSGNENGINNLFNAHCVGHGLIISLKALKEIGGFSEKTMNEDLMLGYLLRSKGIKIHPLPCLELADAPATWKGLWNQKYVWFWGPLRYVEYYSYASKNFHFTLKQEITAIILALQGLISALAWLLSGPILLSSILFLFLVHEPWLKAFLLSSIIIYAPAQWAITVASFKEYMIWSGQKLEKSDIKEIVIIAMLSIPAAIFNSIPPYAALFNEIKFNLQNKEIYKPKTDDQ